MNLGFSESQTPYISESQNARALTEGWVHTEVYCPNCGASKIEKYENNRPVADFYCGSCREEYELKSQRKKFAAKIVDGAFRTMCERLEATNNPNLLLLNYDLNRRQVINLLVVPKHFFVREIIEERPPLAPTARRAGWIGCNIALTRIPSSGKIFLVRDGVPFPKQAVMERWQSTLFLRDEELGARGWLIEVMNCVEAIGRRDFSLSEVYAFEERLRKVYPGNQHIREKIRQQLQVLRDRGYLQFVSRGSYRLSNRT